MELPEEYLFSLTIPAPFDFALTVAKPAGWPWSTPKEQFAEGTLWTGIRIRGIPAGLVLRATGDRVRVRAFTEARLAKGDRDELREIVRYGLGAHEDLEGFYTFAERDPVLKRAVADHPGMRIGHLEDVFDGVILAILLQMAPIARSEQMMDRVLEEFGTRIVFDGREVILWPTAAEVATLDPLLLREKAHLGYRAERLMKAARYLADHPVSLRGLADLPEEEAAERLTAIPGIGRYSAAIIFGESTPPIDSWSVVIMSELYEGKTPGNPRKEIERLQAELSARWGRWSWLAFAYILNDLDALAKEHNLSRMV
jgi:DNA-3-methyladenine glycosylase II